MALYIVTGPPAGGKTTYVREHAKPGDIRIDLDHLANHLAGLPVDNHEHAGPVLAAARAARQAAIDTALKHAAGLDVWIIDSKPTPKNQARYLNHGAEIITCAPGKDIVMRRCKEQRPAKALKVAALWYEEQKPPLPKQAKSTTERGYGWDHQQERERLVRRHRDGTPCWWCNLPMYRDKRRNWDGRPLAADHLEESGAKTGTKARRLLHGNCNSQRQDGSNDHRRPAITGKHPSEPLGSGEVDPESSGFDFGGVSFA